MLISHHTIIGTIKDGTIIRGYKLKDQNGRVVLKDKKEVCELAQLGYITNALARVEGGVMVLKGVGCNLRDIPSIQISKLNTPETYTIINRIVRDKKTIGYTIRGSKGNVKAIDIRTGIKLANNRLIRNVGVQKYDNNEYRLRGKNGFSIKDLPVIKA